MSRTFKYLYTSLLGLFVFAFTPTARAEPIRVVTSIETFADLARAVGGGNVSVESLARGYQDPHFVEAKPNLLVPLSKADLLVYAGLDLEIGWLPPLVQGSRNPRIQLGSQGNLDASTAIDVLDVPAGKVDRSQGDIHPRGNPHYWLPPINALKVAKEIAARLKALDPAHGVDYDSNLQKFGGLLKSKSSEWSRKAALVRDLKVVPYHKSWTYVSDWLGLREMGYVELKPGIQPDPNGAGFKKIVIHPAIVGDLGWVKAKYDSVRGPISTEWHRDGSRFLLKVTVPPNTFATVYLPAKSPDEVNESDIPATKASGVKFLHLENHNAVFEVGSGTYQFTVIGQASSSTVKYL